MLLLTNCSYGFLLTLLIDRCDELWGSGSENEVKRPQAQRVHLSANSRCPIPGIPESRCAQTCYELNPLHLQPGGGRSENAEFRLAQTVLRAQPLRRRSGVGRVGKTLIQCSLWSSCLYCGRNFSTRIHGNLIRHFFLFT